MKAVVLGLVALLFGLLVVGCPGPTFIVQQYRGDIRPPETIATLRVNGPDAVRLLILDDQDVAAPIASDGRLHIEMLPARHTVVVGNASAPSERFPPLTWQAEAGKVYRVAFVPADGSNAAHIYEVDRAKDTVIRDVTLPPSALPLPPIERRPRPRPRPEEGDGNGGGDAGASPTPSDSINAPDAG